MPVKKKPPVKKVKVGNRKPKKSVPERIFLTQEMINILEENGSRSRDWKKVRIHPRTDLSLISDVVFSGAVSIGQLSGKEILRHPDVFGGQVFHPGLRGLRLEHVTLGDHNLLENVKVVRNQQIGDRNVIREVMEISCDLKTAFGIGSSLAVANENGGRSVLLSEGLSAPLAWLGSFHTGDPALQKILQGWTRAEAKELSGKPGIIGNGNFILKAGIIRNVRLGSGAFLENISRLENGTIVSDATHRVKITDGVLARHFVIQKNARLEFCHLGEGVSVGKGANLEHSLLFANSQIHRSEVSHVFGGPFTVSHHQSSLLLAGSWSFSNTGSGSNVSNHHYRLGPVHPGHLSRGVKTGSSSFLMWPARVGAFSTVLGHCGRPMDAGDFPFSLIVGKDEKTHLHPGHLAFSAGGYRDEKKWALRDLRPSESPLDLYHVHRLSPYTMGALVRGLEKLSLLQSSSAGSAIGGKKDLPLQSGPFLISHKSLERGREHYRELLRFYLGGVIFRELMAGSITLKKWPRFDAAGSVSDWTDFAGLLTPLAEVKKLIQKIKSRKIPDAPAFQKAIVELHGGYRRFEKEWVWEVLPSLEMVNDFKDPKTFFPAWRQSVSHFYEKLLEDALKDFSPAAHYSYGLSGDEGGDFDAVRGRPAFDKTLRDIAGERDALLQQIKKIGKSFL